MSTKNANSTAKAWWRELLIPPAGLVWGALLAFLAWGGLTLYDINGRLARIEKGIENVEKDLREIRSYLMEGWQ